MKKKLKIEAKHKSKLKYLIYAVISLSIIFVAMIMTFKKDIAQQSSLNITKGIFASVKPIHSSAVQRGLFYENNEKNIIAINIIFKGGAALDPQGYEGLSAFLIEAMSTAAGGYSVQQFSKMLEDYSVKITTKATRDSTVVTITTISYYRSKAFEVLNLILNNPNLGLEEVRIVRNNMLANYKINSNEPAYLVSKKFIEEVFPKNPHFKEIEGTPNSLNKIGPNTLRSFKNKIITKSNVYVAVSGNITFREVQEELDKIFTLLPEGNKEFLSLKYKRPNIPNKTIAIALPNAAQSEVLLAFNSPKIGTDNFAYATAFNTYLGRIPDSLLFDDLRNKNGLVYTVKSTLYYDSISNYWLVSLGSSLPTSDKAIDRVKRIIKDMKTKDSIDDIVIAKNWLLDSELRYFSNNSNMAAFMNVSQFLGYTVKDAISFREKVDKVNATNIKNMWQEVDTENILIIKTTKK